MSQAPRTDPGARDPAAHDDRSFITPEGVDLRLQLASLGQRMTALLIDCAILIGSLGVLTVALVVAGLAWHSQITVVGLLLVWTLGYFVLRNGYFILFELGGRGATPGKRVTGIRVASRNGARLTAEAVVARNVMREAEIMLPLTFAIMSAGKPDAGAGAAAAVLWSVCLTLLPIMNRDRLRAGDLVAGTWVVRAPRPILLVDASATGEALAPKFRFSEAQLALYGERELQVLEGIVRRNSSPVVAEVAERIRRRIEWTAGPDERDIDFLDAYYLELRRRLEERLLLGQRRRHKNDAPDRSPNPS